MSNSHVVIFGHYGVGNLGNDTTLEAALYNIRRIQPSAQITCVCRGPAVIAARFGVATLPIDIGEDRHPGEVDTRTTNAVFRLGARVFDELDFWARRTRWFRGVDQFLVVGTGAVYDAFSPPWNIPYDLFKWCRAARLGGAVVAFVSVGAGPIVHPASRVMMLNALRAAQFRSYRDKAAVDYLRSVNFDTTGDSVYPDVVFSLPVKVKSTPRPASETQPRVGLGVMGYYGEQHDPVANAPIYDAYVAKLKRFVTWLLSNGYSIRLLTGDLENDRRPADELVAYVCSEGPAEWQGRIVAEPIGSVDDLSAQIAQTDVVVASRFHNIISAFMLGRPVVSVGFHAKNDALMAEMGLQDYCQHIEQLDIDRLITQFESLISDLPGTSARISQKADEYRQLLDEQYQKVLALPRAHARS